MQDNVNELLNTREAAALMRLSPATLIAWRSRPQGAKRLPFVRLGRKVLYRRCDVHAAIQRSVVRS